MVEPHPTLKSSNFHWEPDIEFSYMPFWDRIEVLYGEIKPLTKEGIWRELDLDKYSIDNHPVVILGKDQNEIYFKQSYVQQDISDLVEKFVVENASNWADCEKRAQEIGHSRGSHKKSDFSFSKRFI